MTKRTWRKGPPPHVGWWNASTCKSTNAWRWWDGQGWSVSSASHRDAGSAGARAKVRAGRAGLRIEWTDYYPADARVPRLNPAEGWRLNRGQRPKYIGQVDVAYVDGLRGPGEFAASILWELQGNRADIYAWRPAP